MEGTKPSGMGNLGRIWKRQPLAVVLGGLILVIIILGLGLCLKRCSGGPRYQPAEVPPLDAIARLDSIVMRPQSLMYGLPVEEYDIFTDEVGRGETFSRLLNQRFSVPLSTVNRLIELSKGKFELKDLRAGNGYTAFVTPDSLQSLCYLVYEKNLTEFVTFGMCDSIFVKVDRKNVTVEERYAEGEIKSSLSATIHENKLHPDLINHMAAIYSSSIDFYALQKGDRFRVIYQERMIDSTSIGVEDVYGVEFIHSGKSYWAFRFVQDDDRGYWDDKGVNLRKALLISPLKFNARVTSRFGVRIHPIRRVRTAHNGVDYACPVGTDVIAVADGTVARRGWDSKGGGNYIWLKHSNGLESGYLHLSRFNVKVGDRVRQGEVIAKSGNTGASTGPHLDYRLRKNGKFIDPLKHISEPSTPIKAANKAAFEREQQDVYKVMEYYRKRQISTLFND